MNLENLSKTEQEVLYKLVTECSKEDYIRDKSCVYAAKLALLCYYRLKDNAEILKDDIFITPEVLIKTMEIAYKEIQNIENNEPK